MPAPSEFDRQCMARALRLAARGEGYVEPNPLVGCVIARDQRVMGEGWHGRFGGPHAEVEALRAAGPAAAGATMYVTLEPCCHHGKTPPCTDAVLAAGIARVVVAQLDPFPAVAGQGAERLRSAGVAVEIGLLEDEARAINAPFLKRVTTGRPWVIAKWAMSWDGSIATATGDSRWISGARSRAIVHALRGRMDAIMVGRQTALRDDPLLTARPPGPRSAMRIVLDSCARLPLDSQLVRTSAQAPVLVAVGPAASAEACAALTAAGCEIWQSPTESAAERAGELLAELVRRGMTNLLVEGGAEVLGTFFDRQWIDEVHVFLAPKLIGGRAAVHPVGGAGSPLMDQVTELQQITYEVVDRDLYARGRFAARGFYKPRP